MTKAQTTWIERQRFTGVADSGHAIVVDGDNAAGNSPMEWSSSACAAAPATTSFHPAKEA